MTDPTYTIENIPKNAEMSRVSGIIQETKTDAGAVLVTPSGVAPSVRSTAMRVKHTPDFPYDAICPGCGDVFSVSRHGHIYCSQRCYQRIRRANLRGGPPRKPGPKPGYKMSPEQRAAIAASVPRGERHHNFKGNQVSEKGGRGRALRYFPELRPCERCGDAQSERHHRDGDTSNNSEGNIRFLCRRCHMTEDGRIFRMSEVRAGVKSPYRGRFSQDDIREMFRLRAEGLSQSAIASRFGVRQSYVSRVLSGIRRNDMQREDSHNV